MAAFNWIIAQATCPACGKLSTLRCQTHVASDYAGREGGRFHDREYVLGQPMAWWPRDHARWGLWQVGGRHGVIETDFEEEACHAECGSCSEPLFAVIRFHETVAVRVLEVGRAAHWPEGYVE